MKKKFRFYDWLQIIISILIIAMPFFYDDTLNHKIVYITSGIGILLVTLIENKTIRYAIASICLLVVFFVGFYLFF